MLRKNCSIIQNVKQRKQKGNDEGKRDYSLLNYTRTKTGNDLSSIKFLTDVNS